MVEFGEFSANLVLFSKIIFLWFLSVKCFYYKPSPKHLNWGISYIACLIKICNPTIRQSVLTTATEEISFENFTRTDIILFQDIRKQPWEKYKQAYVTGCEETPHFIQIACWAQSIAPHHLLKVIFFFFFPHNHNGAVCAVLHRSPVDVRQCDLQ